MNTRATTLCTVLIAGAISPLVAHGSGFALLEQSASRLSTAFAGSGVNTDDATSMFFNPAGLGRLEQAQLIALTSGIEISSEFRSTGSTAAFGQPLGGSGGDAGDWNVVPGAYLAVPLGDRFNIGLGINAPFGLKLVYDDGWVGRFQALRSEIQTLNVNPSLAMRVNDRLSIGAGFSYQRLQAELTNAVNYSAVVAQGVQQLVARGQLPAAAAPGIIAANAGLEGDARVRGDDTGWGFNVGMLFDLSDTTRIGLSYRSTIDYDVGGTITFTPPSTISNPVGAGIVSAASAAGAPLSSGPVSVALKVPDSALLSVQQRVGQHLTLLGDVAWTGWSTVQELRVVRDSGVTVSETPERWRDAFRYALGASYVMNPHLTLRAGAAYDNTPVPDATRTPRLPDSDRIWVTTGARWEPTDALLVDFGYAHLFSKTVPLNQNAGSTAASGLLVGEQESDIDIVSAQLVYRF
ncbi:MAG TPA: outer membrane protein transport protein [Steroidobacteraceae bacterium]|nr:outer membrane protein transport protein [Steroidobacteraceae bacterium]